MAHTYGARSFAVGVYLSFLALIAVPVLMPAVPVASAQANTKKLVLVLNSYNQGYQWTDDLVDGIRTALAPMQDVTDLDFMRVIAHYGAPDFFFTEFFRVHAQSRPEANS